MSFLQKQNNAKTTLASILTAEAATLVATDGSVFPASGDFMLTIWDKISYPDPGDDPSMEIVRATARTGDSITITRAQESTSDVEHAAGLAVELLLTALSFTETLDQDLKKADAPTFAAINNIVYVEGNTYPRTAAGIEAAIAYLAGLAGGAGIVKLTPGTYTLTDDIDIATANIILEGCGESTILKLGDAANTEVIRVNANNVTLRNFAIDGNKANNTAGQGIHTDWYVQNLIIENLYIHDTVYSGVNATGCINLTVKNNRIIDCGKVGVDTTTYGFGMKIYGSKQIKIYDNYVTGSESGGIFLGGTAIPYDTTNYIIHNNYVAGVRADQASGIHLYQSRYGVISNNVVETPCDDNLSCGINGIFVNPLSGETELDVTVTGNTINMVTGVGLELGGGGKTVITGNRVKCAGTGTDSCGIWVGGDDIVANGNNVEYDAGASYGHGVTIHGERKNVIVSNNIIKNIADPVDGAAVRLICDSGTTKDIQIFGNQLYDDKETPTQCYGINCTGSGSFSNVQVSGNHYSGNITADTSGLPDSTIVMDSGITVPHINSRIYAPEEYHYTRVGYGPSSLVNFFPEKPSTTDRKGDLSNTTGGTDADGTYVLLGEDSDSETSQYDCVYNTRYVVKIRMKEYSQNILYLNYYQSGGQYVSNTAIYFFSSAFGEGSGGNLTTVGDYYVSFTVPDNVLVAKFSMRAAKFAGRDTKVYELKFLEPTAGHVSDIQVPYKGMSLQKVQHDINWLHWSVHTYATLLVEVQWLIDNFNVYAFRLQFGLSSGMEFDGDGVFTGWNAVAFTNIKNLLDVYTALGVSVIPSIFTPMRCVGSWDQSANVNRDIMTDSNVLGGYEIALAAFIQEFNKYDCIKGWDTMNEAFYMMGVNEAGGTYTPMQIAAVWEALADVIRTNSNKPILLSLADGYYGNQGSGIVDRDKYDIIDQHLYPSVISQNEKTGFRGKPQCAMEAGADSSHAIVSTDAENECLAHLYDGVGALSAMWVWEQYLRSNKTTLTANTSLIAAFKKF